MGGIVGKEGVVRKETFAKRSCRNSWEQREGEEEEKEEEEKM